jgi:beta-galactosidase
VQPTFDFEIDEEQGPMFLDWLRRQYGTIEKLNDAWNTQHCMLPGPLKGGAGGEGGGAAGWDSWEHLAEELREVVNRNFREYRRTRDVYRYKADNYINWLRDRLDRQVEADPHAPLRAGGEMGLFLPFAARGTDMEGIAGLMTERGSFYPSFHPAWHFEEVDFEGARTFYMQATLTTDWFKGGWNATWESTGGPQQMTGHKAPFVPAARDKKPGFTVDAGVMRQLMMSWIAAGYRGFGLWCWSMRTAGWEGGEFALLDRNYRPTDRAAAAGRIGQACRRLRDELWQARKEPLVGVFQDWDMEAIWAATSRGGRDFFKSEPIRARIGAARALINANVPWEHVTGSDLRAGLAGRYRSIIMPACLAVDGELLEILAAFVEAGGRVLFDAPGGWYDYLGRVLNSDDGTPFERLFGCRLADFQYSRDTSRPWKIDGRSMDGTILDLQPTTAETVVPFDLSTPARPSPAITRHRLGEGVATVLAFEATRACFRPGNAAMERLVVEHAMGPLASPYACQGAIVYRLAAPAADHYFLLNDGEAAAVQLDTGEFRYASVEDPVERIDLELGAPVDLPPYSARWLRFSKG